MLLGVDVGGTFTDPLLVARERLFTPQAPSTPQGPSQGVVDAVLVAGERLFTAKAPSTPKDQSEGVMDAVRAALDAAGAEAGDVEILAHGMTVATNALLEGSGARTALVATDGFCDLVELGRQA